MIRFSSEGAAGADDATGPIGQKQVPSVTPVVSRVPVNVQVLVEHNLHRRHHPSN